MNTSTTAQAPASAPAPAAARLPARERLLAAANELFYAEGVHTVGIDRVIEHAGVAKATLYATFGSKDELVRAYLEGRHAVIKAQLARELPVRYATARERLVGILEIRGEPILSRVTRRASGGSPASRWPTCGSCSTAWAPCSGS